MTMNYDYDNDDYKNDDEDDNEKEKKKIHVRTNGSLIFFNSVVEKKRKKGLRTVLIFDSSRRNFKLLKKYELRMIKALP